MAKRKISATVSAESIEQAQAVAGNGNLSDLIERGLDALVERERERRWLDGYRRHPAADDLPGDVEIDLTAAPWHEER
jgi:post-segregation antitoxin (ccd killing protein)